MISTEKFIKFHKFAQKQCVDAHKQEMIFLVDFTSNCKCATVTIIIYFLLETMIMSAVMGQNPDKFLASAQSQ